MITVPAHRVKQFGVEFFQASFSAKDIDRLVKFEVLGYSAEPEVPPAAKARTPPAWLTVRGTPGATVVVDGVAVGAEEVVVAGGRHSRGPRTA